ncbi:N-acetyltransferase [uncultured Rubinisphaera sp.]|uniref:GNAT family N-acetyltransferase n=1 Tax=uncultured Rubinisphaera sp. TaxID=1678686 RepID=UPI0030D7578C|tara:strand:+ start:236 stop:775 length:540 start_codon:yes stop_codon:yes gene_type:complete
MIHIRTEAGSDWNAIRQITETAFAESEFGHNGEAELVDTIRENCEEILSLVAVVDDRPVGHILFSPVTIKTPQGERQGMGLAPLSVLPSYQKQGIGSALITEGLKRLSESGNPFTAVLGHPDYYPRFGFVPATEFNINHGFEGIPQHLFFIQAEDFEPLRQCRGSTVFYRSEFGPQHRF